MKSAKFYTGERHNNQRYKVKKSGYIEEYDGFRLCAFKTEDNKWWIIEEITGLACVQKPLRNLKEAFKIGVDNLKRFAKDKTIPEFIALYDNVNLYKEFKDDINNK